MLEILLLIAVSFALGMCTMYLWQEHTNKRNTYRSKR